MFERYTERARRVIFFARYEASQLGSLAIEAEHLLLGLVREGRGLTQKILARAGLSPELVRREVETRTVRSDGVSMAAEIPLSAASKRVLAFAAEEAERMLHSHIGTFILDPRAYGAQLKTLCALMEEVEADGGTRLDYLDIGGGLPSRNALRGIYLPPEQVVPDREECAEVICKAFLEGTAHRLERGEDRPTLIFESGRAVVDDAQVLVASVVGRKLLPSGCPAVILDAGINLLFTAFWYDHDVRVASPPRGEPRETVLYGPMCMNIDVVRASVQLPPLLPGDPLVISPVGAYNNTQWMQFIEYRPAVVMVHPDRAVSVIRTAEDLESMCAHERMPGHLRLPSHLVRLPAAG